jgi:hypothetical protein
MFWGKNLYNIPISPPEKTKTYNIIQNGIHIYNSNKQDTFDD